MMRDFGETVTLQRTGQSDLSCVAAVAGYLPNELVGGILQGDRRVRISNVEITNASWPGPPRKGDKVVIASRTTTIQGVDTSFVAGVAVMHIIQARG